MERITYGAPRLIDWVAQIKAGAATVRVHFTGGALTSYGVTPAEYTTSDPFIQKVIEMSTYFKEGRIILLRRTGVPEASKPVTLSKPKPSVGAKVEPEVKASCDVTVVAAGCLQDAQAYLQERFGVSSRSVRSYEAAQRTASEHGVRFTGPRFDAPECVESGADKGMQG